MHGSARRLGIIVALATVILGCASSPTDEPAGSPPAGSAAPTSGAGSPKRLITVVRGNPFALAPAVNEAGAGSVPGIDQVEMLLNAGLAARDAHDALQPRLAEAVPSLANGLWQINDDGTMQTTWHLKKPDLVWHNGQPFTTADLAFAIRVMQEPRAGLVGSPAYKLIDRVETPDPQTLTLYWSAPFISADALFATAKISRLRIEPMPAHLLEASFDQDPSSFSQLSYWTSDFVGLGPFKLTDFVPGSHFLAAANDHYVLGRPKIDQLEVDFVADPNTIAANLLAGTIQMTMNDRLDIDWGVQLRDKWTAGTMSPTHGVGWVALYPQFIDPSPAIIGDVRFREALLRALDRQALNESIMAGMSSVGDSLIEPGQPEYAVVEPSIVKIPYDPTGAAQILDGMGLSRGPDGMYRDTDGQPLAPELRTRAGDDLQEKMVPAVADFWKQVGIGSTQNIFGAQVANDRQFRSTRPAFEVVRQPDGADALPEYLSNATPLPQNNYVGTNRTRYQNPDLDALINRFVTTIPLDARDQVLGQAIHLLTANVVVLGLDFIVDATMVDNRISGVDADNPAWNAQEWDIR